MHVRTAVAIWVGCLIVGFGFWWPPYSEVQARLAQVNRQGLNRITYDREYAKAYDSSRTELKATEAIGLRQAQEKWDTYNREYRRIDTETPHSDTGNLSTFREFMERKTEIERQALMAAGLSDKPPDPNAPKTLLDFANGPEAQADRIAGEVALRATGTASPPPKMDQIEATRIDLINHRAMISRWAYTGATVWVGLGVILWGFLRRHGISDNIASR